MDNKAQINLTMIVAVVFLIIIASLLFIFWSPFRFYIIGGFFVIVALIYLINVGKTRTPKKNDFTVFGIIFLIGAVVIALPFFGVSQTIFQTELGAGTYVQAPTFYYYSCEPASQPTESTHVAMTTGVINNFKCPDNTDTCDLWISQTEQTHWYDTNRRVSYTICHKNGQCDPEIGIDSPHWLPWQNSQVPTAHIPNIISTDTVTFHYQANTGVFGLWNWVDQANGAEYFNTYKPFILWKTSMFGGGKTEYTTEAQGCNFPTSDTGDLLNSVTNSKQQINQQSSTDSTHLAFYKTRNFIDTYVPIATANVNFVTYNGQQGYCLNRQIFAITTASTNDATYKIVDSNFNTLLAASVACCPNEKEPTRKCTADYTWQDITSPTPGQCSAFNPCAGADWMVASSKTLIRYNCVNTQCVPETKAVGCTSDLDCPATGGSCDTKTYTCTLLAPGTGHENNTQGNLTVCQFGQESYATTHRQCAILGIFACKDVPYSGCTTSGWVYMLIIAAVIIFVVLIVVLINKPKRRGRK